jgi:hypothetical protein
MWLSFEEPLGNTPLELAGVRRATDPPVDQEEWPMSLANAEAAQPPSRLLLLMEGRALHELATFAAAVPLLRLAPRGDGHPVLVLPGLVASDISTRPLRGFLKDHDYAAHGWKLGRNYGYVPGLERRMVDRIRELRGRYGRKISLIGWSLGGIFARRSQSWCPTTSER